MEELFYCDGCGDCSLRITVGMSSMEKDGEMFCQKCALRMEPVTLLELVDDLERGDVSKWMR